MSENNHRSFDKIADLGFQLMKDKSAYLSKERQTKNLSSESALAWIVDEWSAIESGLDWQSQKFRIKFSVKVLKQLLQKRLKLKHGDLSSVYIHEDEVSGFWLFAEYTRKGRSDETLIDSDIKPLSGMVGLSFNLHFEAPDLYFYLSSFTSIGYLPKNAIADIVDELLGCFAGSETFENLSVFERKVGFWNLFKSHSFFSDKTPSYRKLLMDLERSGEWVLYQDSRGWQLSLAKENRNSEFVVPPIEVIEARDLSHQYPEIDQLILKREFDQVSKLCSANIMSEGDSIYIRRRMLMVLLNAGDKISKPLKDRICQEHSLHTLSLSSLIQLAISENHRADLLKYVTELGSLFSDSIRNFEACEGFDRVLPELLALGWVHKDKSRAFLCYERILEKRGERIDIYQMMLQLMQAMDDTDGEIRILKRMVEVETETGTLGRYNMRLAELLKDTDTATAITYGIRAWKQSKARSDIAVFLSELLLSVGKHQQAIQILDQTLSITKKRDKHEPKSIASVELQIAKIWTHFLRRQDLALERVNRAIRICPRDRHILRLACQLFQDMNLREDEMRVTEVLFEIAIQDQDKEEVFHCFSILVSFFQNEKKNPRKLSKLYQTLVNFYLLEPEELFDLLNLKNIDIEWRKLFESVERQIIKDRNIKIAPYYTILGKVAQDKLQDHALAVEYYEKALKLERQNVQIYEFLDAYYARINDDKNRERILRSHLKEANVGDRVRILKDLFYTADRLGSPEVDYYAIELLKQADFDEPIKKRFALYQSDDKSEAIDKLLSSLLDDLDDRSLKVRWLSFGIEALSQVSGGRKFELLEKYLRWMLGVHEDDHRVWELGVDVHKEDPKSPYLAFYLENLIMSGQPPAVEPYIVLRSLDKKRASRGIYLLSLSKQQEDNEKKQAYLQDALQILKPHAGYQTKLIDAYYDLGQIVLLRVAELQEFFKTSKLTKSMPIFFEALEQQLQKLPFDAFGKDYFGFVLEVVKQRSDCPEQIVHLVLEMVDECDRKEALNYKMQLFLVIEKRNAFFEKSFGFDYLAYDSSWQLNDAFKSLVSWLYEDRKDAQDFAAMAEDKLLDRLQRQPSEDVDQVAGVYDFLNRCGYTSYKVRWQLFDAFLAKGELSRSRGYWFSLLKETSDKDALAEFLRESRACFQRYKMTDGLSGFLGYVIEEDLDSQLSSEIADETRLEYALTLFLQERSPDTAHRILSIYYRKNPFDERVWIPLYFLHLMLGHKYELYDLLKFALPKISENIDLLSNYPVTIESLEKEFRKLAGDLNLPEIIPGYEKSIDRMGSKVSARAPLIGDQNQRPEETQLGVRMMDAIDQTQPEIEVEKNSAQAEDIAATAETATLSEPEEQAGLIEEPTAQVAGFDSMGFVEDVSYRPGQIKRRSRLSSSRIINATNDSGSSQNDEALQNSLANDIPNWRLISASFMAEAGTTENIKAASFSRATEQHWAMQVVAVIENRTDLLRDWQYQVWKDPSQLFFRRRFPKLLEGKLMIKSLGEPLGRLLMLLRPILIDVFNEDFSLRGIAAEHNLRIDEFIRLRQQIDWNHAIFSKSLLSNYVDDWQEQGYRFFHVAGLVGDVLFEFQQQVIYLDLDYIADRPGDAFHSVLYWIKAVEYDLYRLLRLSPVEDMHPFLKRCRKLMKKVGASGLKDLVVNNHVVFESWSSEELELFAGYLEQCGDIEEQQLIGFWDDLDSQIQIIDLYESLDLVGLLQTKDYRLLSRDLELARDELRRSKKIRTLLAYLAKQEFSS